MMKCKLRQFLPIAVKDRGRRHDEGVSMIRGRQRQSALVIIGLFAQFNSRNLQPHRCGSNCVALH